MKPTSTPGCGRPKLYLSNSAGVVRVLLALEPLYGKFHLLDTEPVTSVGQELAVLQGLGIVPLLALEHVGHGVLEMGKQPIPLGRLVAADILAHGVLAIDSLQNSGCDLLDLGQKLVPLGRLVAVAIQGSRVFSIDPFQEPHEDS